MSVQAAYAYVRTSSGTNVGADKDSENRQLAAINSYVQLHGVEIAAVFADPGVSGADPVESRPGFAAMLERIESSGVKLVIVEDSSRLARSVLAGELAKVLLVKRGVAVLASNGDNLCEDSDPMRTAMVQMALVFLASREDSPSSQTAPCSRPQAR